MPDPTYDYLDYDGLALYDEKIKQLIDGKVDKDGAKVLSTNDYTTAEKNKLAGITSGAEPNQNAFSTVVVAGTSLAADSKTDTLTITAGDNVTLTPTAASDSFTIAATDTTYPQATATTGGVLTDAQAVKLNGIATGATKNSATTTTPKMDGTATVGTETAYAKGDHVHPTDTSRASQTAIETATISDSAISAWGLAGETVLTAIEGAYTAANQKQDQLVSGTNIKTINGTTILGSGDITTPVPPSPSSTAPSMDGTAAVGTATTYARADHVHPTDTSRASATDLSALQTTVNGKADKATTLSGYGITDAYTKVAVDDMVNLVEGSIPSAGTTAPKMDGTATVGTSTAYARADHIHPTDTSRAAASALANYLPLAGGTMGADARIGFTSGRSLYLGNSNEAQIELTEAGGDSEVTISASDQVEVYSPVIHIGSSVNTTTLGLHGTSVTSPTPTAGDNSTKVATTAFVTTAVANAIAGIQGISYEVVQTLPATGEAGVIYLVSNSGTSPNIYDEYIWTGTAFEKIGTTDVDLSGYQPLMTAITNEQINALFA